MASQRYRRAKGAVKIDARLLPLSLYRALGNAPHRRDFCEGETAEESQVDNFRQRWIDRGQVVQGLADGGEFPIVGESLHGLGSQPRNLELASMLHGAPPAGMVDDQSAHHPRRIPHEPRPVGKLWAAARRHVQVRLMEKGCNPEAHGSAVSRELAFGQAMQFGVERSEQSLPGARVAALNCPDE